MGFFIEHWEINLRFSKCGFVLLNRLRVVIQKQQIIEKIGIIGSIWNTFALHYYIHTTTQLIALNIWFPNHKLLTEERMLILFALAQKIQLKQGLECLLAYIMTYDLWCDYFRLPSPRAFQQYILIINDFCSIDFQLLLYLNSFKELFLNQFPRILYVLQQRFVWFLLFLNVNGKYDLW